MALFDKAINGFAKYGNKVNKTINDIAGKEIIKGEIKEIEPPREFPPYNTIPAYNVSEPAQWEIITGTEKNFSLKGETLTVTAELDACIKYRKLFLDCANYYTEQFKYKYNCCVNDFDSFVNYFQDMYFEGLIPITSRAYSLLLPFGVFNVELDSFTSLQLDTHNRAVKSYEALVGFEQTRNQSAKNLGNSVGNSVHMQGGGFGMKGAAKGVAQAEIFNLGMNLFGKYVESQSRLSQAEKAALFANFKTDLFFEEVFSDYYNVFLTMVQILTNNNILNGIKTTADNEYNTIANNLCNPMFPQDKICFAVISLISKYPFEKKTYDILTNKLGATDEVNDIICYFSN